MIAFIQYFDENFALKTKEVFESIIDGRRCYTLNGVSSQFFPTALYVDGSRITGVTILGNPNLDVIGFINDLSTNDTSVIPLNAFYNAYDTVVFVHSSILTIPYISDAVVSKTKEYKAIVYFGSSSAGLAVKVLKNTLKGDVAWENLFGDRMIGRLNGGFGSDDGTGMMNSDIYVQKIHNDDLPNYRAGISDSNSVAVFYDSSSADFRMYVHITVYE
ncbi:hypothetical protein B0A81_09625 [Flavobacterium plurextorum]|uniref:Uncharacterized protein n=1 Tax=Flavobacterium plurextorum TaxID=1114867 RepID=A0ABX4CV04_9FLAO|nr:hypothetical protein [Flavobacterium plurextorum]OXB08559.1 hypothetical protein B0A81_09625 [Flavobacterium plurextorum]